MAHNADERTIIDMFRYMRPSGSVTEQAFIDRFLTPLGFERDAYRNLTLQVGEDPKVLFSSHMDTVHQVEGFQTVHYDGVDLRLSKKSAAGASNCLGADDTAGIWLMTEMVKAGVPGLYIIHHCEEEGGIGSGRLADLNPGFLQGIDAAIAFDRNGYDSIVTHQMGRRTASDAFAESLARLLGGTYKPDNGGIFTDTHEYRHLVRECTNISVGYHKAHSRNERQNVSFLLALRDRLIAVDWSKLTIERDLNAFEPSMGGFDDDDWGRPQRRGFSSGRKSLVDLIRDYPDVAADLLEALGVDSDALRDHIEIAYGDTFTQTEPVAPWANDDWSFNREAA